MTVSAAGAEAATAPCNCTTRRYLKCHDMTKLRGTGHNTTEPTGSKVVFDKNFQKACFQFKMTFGQFGFKIITQSKQDGRYALKKPTNWSLLGLSPCCQPVNGLLQLPLQRIVLLLCELTPQGATCNAANPLPVETLRHHWLMVCLAEKLWTSIKKNKNGQLSSHAEQKTPENSDITNPWHTNFDPFTLERLDLILSVKGLAPADGLLILDAEKLQPAVFFRWFIIGRCNSPNKTWNTSIWILLNHFDSWSFAGFYVRNYPQVSASTPFFWIFRKTAPLTNFFQLATLVIFFVLHLNCIFVYLDGGLFCTKIYGCELCNPKKDGCHSEMFKTTNRIFILEIHISKSSWLDDFFAFCLESFWNTGYCTLCCSIWQIAVKRLTQITTRQVPGMNWCGIRPSKWSLSLSKLFYTIGLDPKTPMEPLWFNWVLLAPVRNWMLGGHRAPLHLLRPGQNAVERTGRPGGGRKHGWGPPQKRTVEPLKPNKNTGASLNMSDMNWLFLRTLKNDPNLLP